MKTIRQVILSVASGTIAAALAACGPEPAIGNTWDALGRFEGGVPPVNCRAALPLELPEGAMATLTGDTTAVRHGPTGCGMGAGQYYRFSLDGRAAIYADTFGSSIDAVVGIGPETCGEPPIACGAGGCGAGTSQLLTVLGPGTYHLLVGGSAPKERGPWVLHLRRDPVPTNLLGPIGSGTTTLPTHTFDAFSGGSCPCLGFRCAYAVAWYLTCPEAAGGTVTATVCSNHSGVVVGFRDPAAEAPRCDAADEDVSGCGLRGSITAEDLPGAGIHYVYVGVGDVMSVRDITFTLTVTRP